MCQLAVVVMQTGDNLDKNRSEAAADVQSKARVQQVVCKDLGDCCRVYIGLRSQTHQPVRPLSAHSLSRLQEYW